MRSRILALLLGFGWVQACHQEPTSSTLAESVTELPGDVPAAGRSLFDQMTMVRQGNELVQDIPFPISALRARLEARLKAPMIATLIPKGRSLQRRATNQPFRYPRLVLAATADGVGSEQDLGFLVKDRLYLGYVEEANQLEAISYNPELGRFEFQIIDNYGPGLEPRVRYASRAFCLACHQNESPIFSDPGWDETAANPKIQAQLIKAINAETYLGVPIRQLKNIPNLIDDATDRANFLIPYQKLWKSGCSTGNTKDTLRCRRLSMELALQYQLFSQFDEALYSELKVYFSDAWQRNFPQGLIIPQNNIPNFDPFKDFSSKKDTSFLSRLGVDIRGNLERLAEDKDIPEAVEPLRERKTPLETWTLENDDAARLIFAIAGEIQEADLSWLRTRFAEPKDLHQVFESIAKEPGSLFSANSFARCRTLNALADSIGETLPACELRNFASMPPALGTGKTDGQEGDRRLTLFRRYCSECHGSGSLNFMEGDDATVLARLKADATGHRARLLWETTVVRAMPPANSALRKVLEANPEDRQNMIMILEELSRAP